jgi:hypothetical protein
MGKYKTFGSRFDRVHRNDLNANFADIETDINAQKTRVDDLIAGTPQPSEVVDSRGGFPVLGDRLADLSSSLAQLVTINVKAFGAKGDGVSDDSAAIRAAIAAMPKEGATLLFPKGVYIQGDGTNPHYTNNAGVYGGTVSIGNPIYFEFNGFTNFKISGYGATIKAHANNSCIANNRGFSFIGCENGAIEGLTYDGQIQSRQPWGGDGQGYNDQHAFSLKNCENITFTDVNAVGSVMDGFFLGGTGKTPDLFSNHIKLIRCKALYSYRQGMSVVNGHNGSCYDCEFSYTGTYYGTSPMFGVDLEQGYTTGYTDRGQRNWLFKNCVFRDNPSVGLGLHWGTREALVDGCKFYNNGIMCPSDSEYLTRNNTVINCYFENAETIDLKGGGVHFKDNVIVCKKSYLNLSIGDTNTVYEKGISRKGKFANNYIFQDLTNVDIPNLERINLNQVFFFDSIDIVDNEFINLYYVKEDGTTGNAVNLGTLNEGCKFDNNKFDYADTRVITVKVASLSLTTKNNINNNYYHSVFARSFLRPSTITTKSKGMQIYDTNLNKPIYWNGTAWTDAVGTAV